MQVDSSFERCVAEEEIYTLPEQKPEHLPEVQTRSVLDPDYVPDYLPDLSLVKSEPVDISGKRDYSIIDHIIDQLASVSKAIKQELIDDAAQSVVDRHSSHCALTCFVQEKQSDTGLRIEDVRTLLIAEDESRSEQTNITAPLHVVMDTETPQADLGQIHTTADKSAFKEQANESCAISTPKQPSAPATQALISQEHPQKPSSMDADILDKLTPTHSSVQPLSVVTGSTIPVSAPSMPLHVVTPGRDATAESKQPLPVVMDLNTMTPSCNSPLPVVTPEKDSTTDKAEISSPLPVVTEGTLDMSIEDTVYETLNVEQDDFISISYHEIVS